MISEPRRAVAAFELIDASGAVAQSGEAEAVIPRGLRSVTKLRSRPRVTPASLLATTR